MKPIPTQARIKELYEYDPKTGIFTHKQSRGARCGSVAGSVKDSGYIIICVDNFRYPAHCIAWLYMTGVYPKIGVDHWDTNKSNNAWDNLREATKSQNGANSRMRRNNTSGAKGVTWHAQRKKWAVQITVNRKRIYLGLRDTVEEGSALYAMAAAKHFGEFARL